MSDLRKGDIVQNAFAGNSNSYRYLLFWGKGTCRQGRYTHKVYNCIGYDGKKVQLFREPDGLVKIGHMAEFDAFIEALRQLGERNDDYCSYGVRGEK